MRVPEMERLTVSGETVLHMTRLLLSGEALTRRELAERLQVSTVTVGKIADAWNRLGLLEESVLLTERGRSPRSLRLRANGVAWGIFRMEEEGWSLLAVSPDGRLLSRRQLSYDDAMSPEGNEAMARGEWHMLRRRLMDSYTVVGLGVILRESKLTYWERSIREGIATEADVTGEETVLTAQTLSNGKYGKCVLYLRPERELRSLLVLGREWTENSLPRKGKDSYDAVVESVLQMNRMISIDSITAESHGRYERDAASLLRRLEKKWSEAEERACPNILPPEALTLAERAMLCRLNGHLAEAIADRMGQSIRSCILTENVVY